MEQLSDLGDRRAPDDEVRVVTDWLRQRTRREDRREHPLAFRQLRKILGRHAYCFENPKDNFIDLYREEIVEKPRFLGFGKPERTRRKTKVMQIAYGGEGDLVQVNTIKKIRRLCHLTSDDGVDSRAFYDDEATLDSILNEYRFLLKRLAKA